MQILLGLCRIWEFLPTLFSLIFAGSQIRDFRDFKKFANFKTREK